MFGRFRRGSAPLPLAATTDDRPRGAGPRNLETAQTIDGASAPVVGVGGAARRIGRFVLLDRIGSGAMGVVWSAYDERLDRKVAIKLLARPDDGRTWRLLGEAQALAKLQHPNVVSVYDAAELPEGEVFIAMELVRGTTLSLWQRAPGRTWRAIVDAYVAAGSGLAAAHRQGIVHRDFKPDNALVDTEGRPRVVDFGLAREAVGPTSLAETSSAAGTPGYMAPEQFSGGPIDARADQFSFAAALYEALYGKRPYKTFVFVGKSEAELRALRPERPAELHARWLWEALEQALAPMPGDRHASMEVLLAILTRDHHRARRWTFAGAAVVAIAATTGAGALWVDARASRCAASTRALEGVWDAATKAAIDRAMMGSTRTDAAELWGRTAAQLDQFAARWTAARRTACEDTHVRGVQSAELLDRRIECLDARKRALGAVAAVLTTHPAQALATSSALVDGLGAIDTCSDPGVLRLGLPPPRAANDLSRVEAIRALLADSEALLAAGELAPAVAKLDAAGPLDQALAYAPVHAELLRVRGLVALRQGRLADGVSLLRDALTTATASRHDELAAATWVTLAREAGPSHRPIEEAKQWVALGDAWLVRLGDRDDRRRLELELARGLVLAAAADHEAAIDVLTRALVRGAEERGAEESDAGALATEALGAETRGAETRGAETRGAEPPWAETRLVPLHRARAVSLAAQGRADAAQADYRRALELTLATWGPRHPDAAVTRRALGVLLIEQLGRIDEGVKEIEASEAIFVAAYGERSPELGYCAHALSQAALYRGDYRRALEHAERADRIFAATLGPEHRRRGETLVAIGVLRFMLGEHRGSLDAYEKARGILEANLGAEHVDVGVLASNLGETLLALGDAAGAAERFERALAILRRGLGLGHRDLALPLKGLGLANLARGRRAIAQTALEEALALLEQAGGGDPRELAEVRWALARTLERSGAAGARRRALAKAALEAFQSLGASGADAAAEVRRDLAAATTR